MIERPDLPSMSKELNFGLGLIAIRCKCWAISLHQSRLRIFIYFLMPPKR